ncbi:MAG: haloacid dehalogenase-like hydrolase [Ruminococcus sp.]|nr:haloacid dehalogenase-like hydrolase [Ruminococcus sp.]
MVNDNTANAQEAKEKEIEAIKSRKPRMAICYDFDKTLSPDDMQTFTLIPSFEIDAARFWEESNKLAKENLMETNLAWMYQLLHYSKFKRKSIRKEYFREIGKDVALYKGVEDWFDRMDKYAEKQGIILEHYIISSGLKEIIEGSRIADKFKRIYASSYYYTPDGVAEWPAQAVNYTNKTQFIFRIAKGIFEEYDDRVNDSMPENKLYIPYENIVYIGDSATDIPCMRLVKSKGGYSIGVFDPEKDIRQKVYQLFNDGRINYFAPADYSSRSELTKYVKQIIDSVAAKEKMKTEQMILNVDAALFNSMKALEQMYALTKQQAPKKMKKDMEETIREMKAFIPGNIE